MKPCSAWFSFENRCLLCGMMLGGTQLGPKDSGQVHHLQRHVREGYLNDDYEQIKPHPTGFPGPPLGQQPPARQIPCSPPTTPG